MSVSPLRKRPEVEVKALGARKKRRESAGCPPTLRGFLARRKRGRGATASYVSFWDVWVRAVVMVKFGERLMDMQHAGWEAHYIRYDELKLQIDNIELCQTDEDYQISSDHFLATLREMLVGVDAFVTEQMSTLQAKTDLQDVKALHSAKAFLKVAAVCAVMYQCMCHAYTTCTRPVGWPPPSPAAASSPAVAPTPGDSPRSQVLTRFVGTNVIAATKVGRAKLARTKAGPARSPLLVPPRPCDPPPFVRLSRSTTSTCCQACESACSLATSSAARRLGGGGGRGGDGVGG